MKLLYRRIGIVVALVVIAGSVLLTQILSRQKEEPAKTTRAQKKIRTVPVFTLHEQEIQANIDIQGRLLAYNKIDVFAEVSGTLLPSDIRFKEGNHFRKGDVLLHIDDQEARLALLAQKSTLLNNITRMMPDIRIDFPESVEAWEKYIDQYDPEGELSPFPTPQSKREKLFITARELYTQYYNIKSTETRLDKYIIQAPFNGVVTESTVNPGTLIRMGQRVGTLMSTGLFEMEANVAMEELNYFSPGDRAEVYSTDIDYQWKGQVARINDQIDPSTQTVKVFITLSGPHLREGMFLNGTILGKQLTNVHAVPKEIVIKNEQVWVLEDTLLRPHAIKLEKVMKDTAVVSGLSDGMILPAEQLLGAYDGMPVKPLFPSETPAINGNKGTASHK